MVSIARTCSTKWTVLRSMVPGNSTRERGESESSLPPAKRAANAEWCEVESGFSEVQ